MTIKQVRALVNGTWYTLAYDSASGTYQAEINTPSITSYHLPGGVYNVTVEVANNAGTTVTADGSSFPGLLLEANERTAPVITIVSPGSGASLTSSKPLVVFTVVDEANGSGVDLSSLVVKLDGTAVAGSTIATTAITNGYSVTYTPASALSNGGHTVTIDVSDNDGNAATQKSTTFTVDTVPPTLNITAPSEGLITANKTLNVVGTTNDAMSSPVTVTVTLNGVDQGEVTVSSSGSFSKQITLSEGSNTIVVTSTDASGLTTSVTRTVELDTSVPKIVSAFISPNPADTGSTVVITVVVQEGG